MNNEGSVAQEILLRWRIHPPGENTVNQSLVCVCVCVYEVQTSQSVSISEVVGWAWPNADSCWCENDHDGQSITVKDGLNGEKARTHTHTHPEDLSTDLSLVCEMCVPGFSEGESCIWVSRD